MNIRDFLKKMVPMDDELIDKAFEQKLLDENFLIDFFEPNQGKGIRLPADIYEGFDKYIIVIDMPGITHPGEIDVKATGMKLHVQGVISRPGDILPDYNLVNSEINTGKFRREIKLPGPVDINDIKARYKNGQLIVKLYKLPEAQKTVSVNWGD